MSSVLKQQMIVDNVNGAGGTIGTARAAKAPPDGYTLLLMHVGIATAPALYRKLPYDAITDLEPIGRVADVPMTLVARKTLPPQNLRDFLSYAKANKDKLTLATAGVGSASHLCGMLFMRKIDMAFNVVQRRPHHYRREPGPLRSRPRRAARRPRLPQEPRRRAYPGNRTGLFP
jgi:tripartite-type tricarboxylate transporter receptor subunit TctC